MKRELELLKTINDIGGLGISLSNISDNCYNVGLDILGRELRNIFLSLEKDHLICLSILEDNKVI